jgi:hypothetical protein
MTSNNEREVIIVAYSIFPEPLKRYELIAEQFENITYNELHTRFSSIRDAASKLRIKNPEYVRRILLTGGLEGIKTQEPGYQKWWISPESIEIYKRKQQKRAKLRRYILYIAINDEAWIRETFDHAGIEYKLEVAYKGKHYKEATE